ncbi:MAG: ATP-binding protein [Oscillospiraceae bacterium]|nr:ATP-binding protein [Oscillospiraceae bacterium]
MRSWKKSIKTYLFLANSLMVVVVVGLFMLIYGVLISAYEYHQQNDDVSDRELADGAYELGVMLTERDWDAVSLPELEQLGGELEDMEFYICVTRGGEVLYSTLGDSESETSEDMEKYYVPDGAAHIYFVDGMTAVTLSAGDTQVCALNFTEGVMTSTSHIILLYLVAVALFMLILSVSGLVSTRRLTRHIMRPLDKLITASESVQRGDYSHRIEYNGDWEFENVCSSFNEMQNQIRENESRAAAYEKARTDVVAGISHDLRTPLTAIRGTIKGMQDGVAKTPEMQKKFLDTAYQRTLEMERLLEQLFYFSKMETGDMPLFIETVEWGTFLDSYVDKLRRDTASPPAEFILENKAGAACSRIDRREMERALNNIVVNSRKYAGAEHLTVRFSLTREGERVLLRIADNGRGVPEEKLPLIFDKFYRADESRTRPEGNGLGLHIVKYLAEAMQGTVRAENNGGLQIDMTFPIAEEGVA